MVVLGIGWVVAPSQARVQRFFSSSALISNLLKSDRLLTTQRSPSTENRAPLQARVQRFVFCDSCSVFRVSGFEFRVSGSVFRVSSFVF